jgi:hypothetical protein
MVSWPIALGPELRQYIMVGACGGGRSLPHCGQEAKRDRKELGSQYPLQRHPHHHHQWPNFLHLKVSLPPNSWRGSLQHMGL